jgi:hypothetical protein
MKYLLKFMRPEVHTNFCVRAGTGLANDFPFNPAARITKEAKPFLPLRRETVEGQR